MSCFTSGSITLVGMAFERIPIDEFTAFTDKVIDAFQSSNLSEVIELFRMYPEHRSFSFFDMFKDEQIKMLTHILEGNLELAASSYQKINDRNYNLLNVMKTTHLQPPKMLVQNLEMVLNSDLRQIFSERGEKVDIYGLQRVIDDIKRWDFEMDHTELNYLAANKLNSMLMDLGPFTNGNSARSREVVLNMQQALQLLAKVGIVPDLNEIQDVIFTYMRNLDPEVPEGVQNLLKEFSEYINIAVPVVKWELD